MTKLPLIKTGDDDVGIILSEDMLALLNAAEGDELILTEEPNGFLLNRLNDAPG